MSILKICQCAFAAVVLGAGVTALAIGGRAWLQPALLTLTAIACPSFLVMITSLSALPKIMRWKADHRLCIAGNGLACLFWGMSFSAACAIENAGAGTASWNVTQTQALTSWTAAIMAACASGVEFFLFLASTLVTIYYYHLALVDYRLCEFRAHVSYRQKILALEEPLPPPNAPFRKSVGPRFLPKSVEPKVPQRSSLRAIAHLNNQNKYPGLKSKLSQVSKSSKSLEELGLEAVSVPLPDSPPLELDVVTENQRFSTDTTQNVAVPVFMAQSSGRLPLRQFSTSPLSQETEAFPLQDSGKDSALGISPMFPKPPQPSLLDLALKSPRVPPKKRPTPLAPIALPTSKLSSTTPPKQFSEVLSESSWPLPAIASKNIWRSASFSSTQRKKELVPHVIARASSVSPVQRKMDLMVPLENPRAAPLSPLQRKEESVKRMSVIQAALNQEKEGLVRRRSEKKETLNQEKKEVARQKSLQRESLDQEKKTEIIRLKSLRGGSSADLVRLRSLKRENSKSPGSASFAENARRFSTLAPSFRIGKTKPRPNLSLKGSILSPSSTDDTTTKRKSWGFGRPPADSLDSPPLTSLTFSNWGESNGNNESRYDIAAPPPSPATLAASIKTNKKRISSQKQKKVAKAKAVAAKKEKAKAEKEKAKAKAKEEECRRGNLSPEAERYYTRSPYDFSSSDNDEDDDDSEEIFALDTNCVPGSAQNNPLSTLPYPYSDEPRNWSTTTHFGDGNADDNRRSMSVYSHQGSQSVYSVDTNGLPPPLPQPCIPPWNLLENGEQRIPMSSLHSTSMVTPGISSRSGSGSGSGGMEKGKAMAVPPLFHRVSLNRGSVREGVVSPVNGFVGGAYKEEIDELAREFLGGRGSEEDGRGFESAV
ncbi:hypothetical protein E2P81_ATG00328 [Venturia nashicola]|nr:hypothetical protein E2P81_ATG00328 [Venturia nashicola]